jgi:8-oxo-dGTP diphosphatase
MNVRHDMVTVFVVRPDAGGSSDEFLQLRRARGDYMGETWQIIRGGVDAGETYAQAALRELREESGLTAREFYRLGSVESFYTEVDDTLWHSVPFCARIDREQEVVLNDEHDASRWIHRNHIAAETMWASERIVLADLMRDILDDGPAKPHLRINLDAGNS